MDKHDYIESIIIYLKSHTGINFQLRLKEVFSAYYKSIGKKYEMPDYYGGDQKNDGWVVEDAIFHQIFGPTRLKNSLRKEIQEKFKEDLTGLLEIIYVDKKWNGYINEFIFIVNTFDNNLPHDSEGFFESTVSELKEEYNIDFDYRVENIDYVREILLKIVDIEILKQISATLHIKNFINSNAITETIIFDLIMGISGNLNNKFMSGKKESTYDRVSTITKIDINNLGTKKEEIENIISQLDVVENAVNSINLDVFSENKFERVMALIIEKYTELTPLYNGVELYEKLIEQLLSYSNDRWNLEMPMKFLIVYVFDKCDIFEK